MGFPTVYNCLREVFPEVDFRILRAVAHENPEDVNVAVNDVLTEVIPRFYEEINLPSKVTCLKVASDIEVGSKTKTDSLRSEQMAAKENVGLVESGTIGGEASDDIAQHKFSEVGLNSVAPRKSNCFVHEDHDHKHQKQIPQIARHLNRVTEDIEGNKELFDGFDGSMNYFHSYGIRDWSTTVQQLISSHCNDCSVSTAEDFNSQIANPSFENHSPVRPEIQLHSEPDHQKSNANGTSSPSPRQERSTSEMSVNEERFTGNNSMISQSGEPCRVELLDEIIEDAKSNKVFLFSAMESVINKMRELEQKEKDAEKAREAAANGGSEITAKLEKLKQTLAHAIEENDMKAGEVYGEKAILATETRELQSRLLSLSDERDNSLSILDEMYTTLEARIAAVNDMLEAAQEAKLGKEEDARNALAEQEALMEKLVLDSMILRQEEEENSKLRDFLMNRGRIVDALQGEISVICQDVRHLKEKFDKKVPLSQSLSSSQKSCILASSSSSLKSTAFNSALFCLPVNDIPSDLAYEKGATPNTSKEGSRASSASTSKEGSAASSASSSSSESLEEEKERERNDTKAFSDDGWDVFDKYAEFAEAPHLVDAKE